jgi:hypothetical protein
MVVPLFGERLCCNIESVSTDFNKQYGQTRFSDKESAHDSLKLRNVNSSRIGELTTTCSRDRKNT